MGQAPAILAACQMLRQPALVRVVREGPLPPGITFLLEIASGEADALAEAWRLTGYPPEILTEAAGFFVEQILFKERADHYRILGAASFASTAELRHHMALLMRWLHPDATTARAEGQIDRSVFATRITAAWQTLKDADRRADYDGALRATASKNGRSSSGHSAKPSRRPKLALRPMAGKGLLSRLLLLFVR